MNRFLFRLTLFLLAPLLAGLLTFLFLYKAFLSPLDISNVQPTLVEVAPGRQFKELCHELQEKGILRYWWSLHMLARFSNKDTLIKAGEYELAPAMTPREVLAKILSGDVFKRAVLMREGTSVWEIGKALEQAGLMKEEDFNRAVVDPALLATAGIKAQSFEGYLFPETYYFSRPVVGRDIIWRMLEEGDKHWDSSYSEQASKLKLSRYEVLTLASVIEKESGNAEEQPMISSVFHNRLNRGMKLQSDPTVIYGIKDFDGNLTKEHLQSPHPYNTYVNYGLPPGPICNAGESAIKAALFPKESNNLFFVADGRGGHVFSETLQQHNEAVAKYQLNRQGGAPSPAATETTAGAR